VVFMIYSKENFRIKPGYPTYPPYHVGDYLEDYFYNNFLIKMPKLNTNYIGISWTTLYCDNKKEGLQEFLNNLPENDNYFTVSQHDDAPIEKFPKNTIIFSAGGNVQGQNIIPIPLVCSPLPVQITKNSHKPNLLACFVGSYTHPIRKILLNVCKPINDIIFYMRQSTGKPLLKNEFEMFIDYALNSKFCLCPRGYGLNSFRIYESMQLGCIPVIITDKFYLPWEDELDWKDFSVLITENDIPNLEHILRSYSEEKINYMKNKINELWPIYFSLDGVYNNIIKRLK